MTNDKASLLRRQEKRLAVLKHIYDEAARSGRDLKALWVDVPDVTAGLQIAAEDAEEALSYLHGRALLGIAYQTFDGTAYHLSQRGIDEVELSILNPVVGTPNFAPQVTQHFYGMVGAVQTGDNATANITQTVGPDISTVLALLDQLKKHANELNEDNRDEAQTTLESLETELQGKREPRKINVFLKRLASLAQGTVAFASQIATLGGQLKDLGIL